MRHAINSSLVSMLSLALGMAFTGVLNAQMGPPAPLTGAADGQLRNIQARNSAAQFTTSALNQQTLNRAVPRVGVVGVNQRNFLQTSNNPGPAPKPFSTLNRGPSVTPYLNLSNPFSSTVNEYYTQIRPQREAARQQQQSQQVARRQAMQQRRLSQLAAMGPYSITGSEEFAPTGHGATHMEFSAFQNTGMYFAPMTRPLSSR